MLQIMSFINVHLILYTGYATGSNHNSEISLKNILTLIL